MSKEDIEKLAELLTNQALSVLDGWKVDDAMPGWLEAQVQVELQEALEDFLCGRLENKSDEAE